MPIVLMLLQCLMMPVSWAARLTYLSASDPTEPEDATLDIGGGAEAAALSSIVSPGIIHRLSCIQVVTGLQQSQ